MGCWSAENATKAYLKTIKLDKRSNEPNIAEFISAVAAGNNAKLMVVACANTAGSTTLALVAAAHQTGGRVVCIVRGNEELQQSKQSLGCNASHVEFIKGEAKTVLLNQYKEADFLVIDCKLENHGGIVKEIQEGWRPYRTIVLGYNAFCCNDSWQLRGSQTQLLPIGEGLLLTRVAAKPEVEQGNGGGFGKRGHWVVKVDKYTGEEHVFRVRSIQGRVAKS